MVKDYSKSKIYKIVHDTRNEFYVGSTNVSLSERIACHKRMSHRCQNRKFYKFVSDHGGWGHFMIVLLENYPCAGRKQLLEREQYYIDVLKSSLNDKNSSGRDVERQKKTEKKCRANYRRENKEYVKQLERKYYQENKQKVFERNKNYKNKNKQKYDEYYKTKVICDCGSEVSKRNLARHKQSPAHLRVVKL